MSYEEQQEKPLLATEHLTKIYTDGAVTAVRDVDLEIRQGEYVAIMGPSGCGKSTLLQLLGALDVASAGDVYFKGRSLSGSESLDSIRSDEIGFVFQSFYLLPNLTAVENVQLPMFESRLSPAERCSRAEQLLNVVGMSHRTDQLPTRLSVGERQRVAIARSLANDPAVLLADEPTGNLDSHTGGEILDLFANLHQDRGMTIVMVTHDSDVAACAGRLLRMRDGQIVSDESMRSADNDSASEPKPPRTGP